MRLYIYRNTSVFIKMNLDTFLTNNGVNRVEGSITVCKEQVALLKELVSKPEIKSIFEIGFNAGHSSELFLEANKDCIVLSFDYGAHTTVTVGKRFIEERYPRRHMLILGDSTQTIPRYTGVEKYDVIFIDGGHSLEVATADLANCRRFAHANTIVIMDDTNYTEGWERVWTTGPTAAWKNGVRDGLITELARAEFAPGHGMSWGKYVLNSV